MTRWRMAGMMLAASLVGSSMSTGAIMLYWKMEVPPPLRPVAFPRVLVGTAGKAHVAPIPTKEYAYLGPYSFNTRTVDSAGVTVWTTPWVEYDPGMRYKFVTPVGLPPGVFSVMLNIDYALNPIARAEDSVKFLDLVIQEKEDEGDSGAD